MKIAVAVVAVACACGAARGAEPLRTSHVIAEATLRFEPTGERDRWRAHGAGFIVEADARGFELALPGRKHHALGDDTRLAVPVLERAFALRLVGGDRAASSRGERALPGVSHYTIGDEPARWRRDVHGWERVRFASIYRGVDVVYYGTPGELEYDFVVAPGADASRLRFTLDGARRVRLASNGDLLVRTAMGDVRHHRPVAYQEIDGARRPVDARFVTDGRVVRLRLGRYDRARELVIDPRVKYFTYVGGAGADGILSIALDHAGNTFVAGLQQLSAVNPVLPVVKKYDSTGTFVAQHFLSGNGGGAARAVTVNAQGWVYIAGYTTATNLPTTTNAYEKLCPGTTVLKTCSGTRGWVAKLDAALAGFQYVTYMSGSYSDEVWGLAADDNGYAYVVGDARSPDFTSTISTGGYAQNCTPTPGSANPCDDAFVAELLPDGTNVVFTTFLGGEGIDHGRGIALKPNPAGLTPTVYVVGDTAPCLNASCPPPGPMSVPFPTTATARQRSYLGTQDAWLVSLTAFVPQQLLYSTFIGGNGIDGANGVAVDAKTGVAYVVGTTTSTDFPNALSALTIDGWTPSLKNLGATPANPTPGTSDAFVVKVDDSKPYTLDPNTGLATSDPLQYSVLVGGAADDTGAAIALDPNNLTAWITGHTYSTENEDPPMALPGCGTNCASNPGDAFAASVTQSTDISFTYLGGSADDHGWGVTVDANDVVYVVGTTLSSDLSAQNNLNTTPVAPYNASSDGFLIALTPIKRPLVFIPGLMASELYVKDDPTQTIIWPPKPQKAPGTGVSRFEVPDSLSLWVDEDCERDNFEVGDIVRVYDEDIDVTAKFIKQFKVATVNVSQIFYKGLIDYLVADPTNPMTHEGGGYFEYKVCETDAAGQRIACYPERRTAAGCDLNQAGALPTLFPYAYDWRQDNATTAANLDDYITCIQKFYPNTQVDIVAHSMGGLVARAYALQHSDKVHSITTIGTPWLGVPKLYYVVQTGDIIAPKKLANLITIDPYINAVVGIESSLHHLAASFTGPMQLGPSQAYFTVAQSTQAFPPVALDQDANLSPPLNMGAAPPYSYSWSKTAINNYQAYFNQNILKKDPWVWTGGDNPLPGDIIETFHTAAQDDFSTDQTPIKYRHIIGRIRDSNQQLVRTTIGGTVALKYRRCYTKFGLSLTGIKCAADNYAKIIPAFGDGTVTSVSGARTNDEQQGTVDLNKTPNDLFCVDGTADQVEHAAGLPNNLLTERLVVEALGGPPALNSNGSPPRCFAGSTTQINNAGTAANWGNSYYLTAHGVQPGTALIDDPAGKDNGDLYRPAPGVVTAIITPSPTVDYTFAFQTDGTPTAIDVEFGNGAVVSRMVRYQDLQLPANAWVAIVISASGGLQSMQYDSDGDGVVDTTVTPAVDSSGPAASDTAGPTLAFSGWADPAKPGNVMVAIAAADPSGVADVGWSSDGNTFSLYGGPVSVDPAKTPIVYAFADDTLGNRSSEAQFTVAVTGGPPPPPADGGAAQPDGGATTPDGGAADGGAMMQPGADLAGAPSMPPKMGPMGGPTPHGGGCSMAARHDPASGAAVLLALLLLAAICRTRAAARRSRS